MGELNEKRIENSKYLLNELDKKDIPWLTPAKLENHIKHTFFWCPILVDEEKLGMSTKELRKKLKEKGVETRHRYQEPLYKQRILTEKNPYPKGFPFNSKHYNKNIDYKDLYLENVESIAGRLLGLPNHPKLTKEHLDQIVQVVSSFDT